MAAEHQDGAVGSYDGTSYCAEDFSENVADQYPVEVPPWIDSSGSHWQQSGYAVEC